MARRCARAKEWRPMSEIILHDAVVADDWQVLCPTAGEPVAVPAGPVIVPLSVWLDQQARLAARSDIGVWLAGNEDPSKLRPWLASLSLIAVEFAKFTDGRGYSIAYLLRSRLGYRGELRAIGDVLPDQLFFMKRVGFDAFAVRADKDVRQALRSLRPFTDAYQGSWDNAVPAFRRHDRAWPSAQDKS
jgi:uncharacterized protein (DUF934 family)